MPPENKLRLGTRGSNLALIQTRQVVELLAASQPELALETVIVKTRGDLDQTTPLDSLPSTGYFTKELEQALVDDTIDIAVHSLKDMAAQTVAPYYLAAVLPRGRAEDALLLNPRHRSLADLPERPFFLTGSVRRQRQLARLYPGCRTEHVRGNIQTRIRKLSEQDADALVVAAAAIDRLGIDDQNVVTMPIEKMIPAPAQGAVAIECLESKPEIIAALARIDDRPTREAVDIERKIMAMLEGGCSLPLGVHVYPESGDLHVLAGYFPEETDAAQIVHERIGADHNPAAVAAHITGRFNI